MPLLALALGWALLGYALAAGQRERAEPLAGRSE